KILNGGQGMPAFGPLITDQQVAAVATYIRNSWGNDYGGVGLRLVAQHSGGQEQLLEQQGGRIYEQQGCAGCHGREGNGGVGPALAGDPALRNHQYVITQILYGGGGMPAFGEELSDQQIADVATFIRTSWGNQFGPLLANEVVRQGQGGPGGGEQQGQRSPDGAQVYAIRACANCHGANGE